MSEWRVHSGHVPGVGCLPVQSGEPLQGGWEAPHEMALADF